MSGIKSIKWAYVIEKYLWAFPHIKQTEDLNDELAVCKVQFFLFYDCYACGSKNSVHCSFFFGTKFIYNRSITGFVQTMQTLD